MRHPAAAKANSNSSPARRPKIVQMLCRLIDRGGAVRYDLVFI